jgi:hypothetical protein
MTLKIAAALCVAAVAMSAIAADPADAATKKRTAAKKYGPVPVSMDPPRARVTVQRRTYLDPGRVIAPGSQPYFTDYAFPPAYSPTAIIDNRAGVYIDQSPLPGPFTLPGRDNPYPWGWCVGC